jgi:hypothetical protein
MSATAISTMTTMTTMTTNTFDECLNQFGKQMQESYTINEQGDILTLPEDQMADIANIIEASQERVTEIFKPLFDNISKQIEANQVRINQLLQQQKNTGHVETVDSGEGFSSEDMPTIEWLLENRNGKSGNKVTGYNVFTMFYMSKMKSGFPPKGLWDQQNKAAWNALADQVCKASAGASSSSSASASASAVPVDTELPNIKGHGKNVTAYNMFTIEYMQKNPGAGFPPSGTWAQVSKEEKARFEAMAKAVKAQRA